MKSGIHPKYVKATVTCACGNTWETMSTKENMRTDLCSKCHPFFTGEQRIVDTAGQVERFKRRSRNKANVPPPPQERRPAPVAGEGAAEDAAADTETVEA